MPSFKNTTSSKTTPFSRNLKGIFFFLVVLVVVSQISPLLMLQGLIGQEERRADGRLASVTAGLRSSWDSWQSQGNEGPDFGSLVALHGLKRLSLAAFLPDSQSGSWHFRTEDARAQKPSGWDSVSTHAPQFTMNSADAHGIYSRSIDEIWNNRPVKVDIAVATPAVAALRGQLRTEVWLRCVVLVSFGLFTLLFYRSVLLPFHDMRKRATALVDSGVLPPTLGGAVQDPEYVMATFDHLVHKLSKQAGQMEQRALHSERVARDVEQFNEYILSSMTTGMIILGQNGEILRFNRAAEQILRLPAEAMIGRHYSEAGLSPNLVEMFESGLKNGEAFSRHELRVEREAGDPTYLGINTSCIRSDRDEPVGLSVLMTDLTAIKKLQDEVAENQRLADLGELAAGLAHQLRNSMAAILGYGRLLQKATPDNAQLGGWADGLLAETNETSDMITRFLDFARPLHAEQRANDLVTILENSMRTVQPLAESNGVELRLAVTEAGHPVIAADEILLKQAFVNLLQNAVEASQPGGHVSVSIRANSAGSNSGRWLVFITDEGCGVPPENVQRIFQPFFTTKDAGTGLGLALARKIVVTHGGSLILQHSTRSGSTFLISLPMCLDTVAEESTASQSVTARNACATENATE